MRLHRIAVRDFRGVADREVELADSGITVVTGPNEVGKSSLADALDMVLRLPDSSNAREVRDAVPAGRDVGPRVEIEMTLGSHRFVLAKQWAKGRMTSLDVLEPERRQLTGRDAHQWVQSALDASLDADLWNALRVAQGTADGPVDVHTRSLSQVLDAALGIADTGGDEGLVARVDAERGQYWTATGRPKRQRLELDAQLVELDAEASDLERQIAELASLSTRVDQLRTEHTTAVDRVDAARADLDAAEQRVTVLDAARRTLSDAESAAEVARSALASADGAVAYRREALDDLAGAAADVEKLASELERSSAVAADAGSALRDARARLTEVDAELTQADTEAHSIEVELSRRSDVARLADLRRRVSDAVDASRRATDVSELLDSLPAIDGIALRRVEAAATSVIAADARLDGASTHVQITALVDLDVEIDGAGRHVLADQTLQVTAADDLGIAIPGVAEVRVSPADGAADLAAAAADAHATLAAACRDLGVDGVAEARRVHEQRAAAERAHADAVADEERALRGASLDDLQSDIEHLDARLASVAQPSAEVAAMADADLEASAGAARARRSDLIERRDDIAADLAHHQQRVEHAQLDDVALAARLEHARQQHERLDARVADARELVEDDILEAASHQARSVREDAEAAVVAARRAVIDLRPDDVESDLVTRQRAARGLEAQVAELAREIDQIQTRLDVSGERGLAGELDDVRRRREHLSRRREQIERRAVAAQTLHEAITHHRDAARRRYAAPYRAELERLGQLVFGPDLEVVLDEDMHIERRVLDGIALDVDQLSVGAREQLGLLARLACASIVGDDGVPVIFDDVLGHADPDRVAAMGRALEAASGTSQIVITTCSPDRYAGIDATWIELT